MIQGKLYDFTSRSQQKKYTHRQSPKVVKIRKCAKRRPNMEIVEISNDYQIFIPSAIRELLSLMPGQKIQMIAYEN